MNIAFLFNSDHPTLGGYYGPPVMERILGTNVLQNVRRHMRVCVGDILTYSAASRSKTPTRAFLIDLCKRVYVPRVFDRLQHERLEETHGDATVFCWLFQNMTPEIADSINDKLQYDPVYLGAMDVDFSDPLHLYFFRNSLCENYRLSGQVCSVFYSMGNNEDPDIVIREEFEGHGFKVVYEDTGARRTVFDNFDSIEHFKRVEDFKRIFSQFNNLGEARASDLAHCLEEVHPKMFDAFASAARALERAETGEDYAQAALSGRRLLEKTADYLFPPREEDRNGRKVGRAEYKNRLWAYIEDTLTGITACESNTLATLGKEADRLVELFNSGLHADPTREKIESALTSLVIWLSEVIDLSPEAARRPYLAYEQELLKFWGEVTKDID